jgi:hypothetical protein
MSKRRAVVETNYSLMKILFILSSSIHTYIFFVHPAFSQRTLQNTPIATLKDDLFLGLL